MKKILIDGMTNNMGGMEKFIHTMFELLKDSYQIDFITVDEHIPFEEEFTENRSQIYRITPRYVSLKKFRSDIKAVFKKGQYDAFWFNKTTLSSIDALKFAKKYHVKKIVCHSHSSKNMGGKFTLLMHMWNKMRVNRFVNYKIACSTEAAEWFFGKDIKQVIIFENAIDVKKYETSEEVQRKKRSELALEGKFVIGHIGRFSEEKNHKFLFEIFQEVLKKEDTQLVLCGEGAMRRDLEGLAKEKGIYDNISFLGIRKDIPELLQVMDVFVFPSLFEGLPFSLVEAQAAGVPCVVSNTVSKEAKITDLVQFLSLKQSAEEWADCILNLRGYKKISKEQQLIDKGYSLDVMKNKIQQILE